MSSAEKTEDATPRKRQKERERGNIAKSRDLSSALNITVGVAILYVFANHIIEKFKFIMVYGFTHLMPKNIVTDDIWAIFAPYARATAEVLIPIMFFFFITTIIIIRMQVGNVFALEKLKPKMENISPKKWIDGLKRLINPFNMKQIVELLKSLLKIIIVGSCGYSTVHSKLDELYGLLGADVTTGFMVIGAILTKMLINMCLAMLILGILDFKYQKYEFDKSIKMTKQEVKDEWKNTEGDPKIKSKIRSIQMQMAQQRMMSAVPTADVVVTNPTHYAVAIKYDRMVAGVPIVVAKGVDYIAFKIREIATANKVPIVENRSVARALYNLVPVDGAIPEELFKAVAEILAHVYRKNQGL